jgi:hypothetical protein
MRVISQDGTLDFPYELSTVRVYNEVISMGMCKDDSCRSIIARYSTEEKALKAMEMLREVYLKYMEIEGHADLTGQGIIQPNFWVLPKVFQFPQDDEIEVEV